MAVPTTMSAAIFRGSGSAAVGPLSFETVPVPTPSAGEALIKVLACGVCRTDLHIVEGDLPMLRPAIIPGHQVVGEIVHAPDSSFHAGDRVGVAWMGGTDGTCKFCRNDRENLCDSAVFTGYSRDGGYAEYLTARTDFLIPLPRSLDPATTAPLLCAGLIGYRSLCIAAVKPGHKVGLFGFGASARLVMPVLRHWGCEIYVATRGEHHREEAVHLGATWVGDAFDPPPARLDAAVIFAPVGDVVLAGLKSLEKGGVLAINAIHLDQMPAFDYDSLLWHERQIRSVANMTRQDGKEYLRLAQELGIRPAVKAFSLDEANSALAAIKFEDIVGSAVIVF